mgnify:CR=1 FL=1
MEITGLKRFLGVLAAILALGMGWGFWVYFMNGVVMDILLCWGIYICINLSRFKKWAWQFFICIITLSLIMEFLFISFGGVEDGIFDWFLILIVITSSIVMIVFGVSFIIRRLIEFFKD